jgi:type VI secretion system secreted protein Hcp
MAVDMFLKLDGVKGESKDKTHFQDIDILSWSWGMSNSGSAHQGSGAGSGKVNVQDVSITKYIDSSSPKIMLSCCDGAHFATAMITVRKAGGGQSRRVRHNQNAGSTDYFRDDRRLRRR